MERFAVEFNAQLEGNTLAGYAHVFGYVADRGGYYATVKPGAFDDVLDKSDTLFLFNHNRDHVLGRKKAGTLRLNSDERGLAFEVDLPDTTLGNDVKENVRLGNIPGMSFGVTFNPRDHIRRSRAADGKEVRTFTSFADLVDVSVVTVPAFEGTEIMLNSKQEDDFLNPPNGRVQLLRARLKAAHTYRRV